MFWVYKITLFMGLLSAFCDSSKIPSNVPCKLNDDKCITGLAQWLYSSVIGGVPEEGIDTSDPIYQERIEGILPYAKFYLKKTNIEGFKTCKVIKSSINSDVTIMHIDFICRRFHMDGDYIIDGKLLQIPIKGEGGYYLDATNYHISVDIDMEFFKKDGKTHVVQKKYKFTAALMGELDLEMQNLFEGKNKDLSDVVHKFARQNPRIFASLLQDPVISVNIKKFLKSFNKRLGSIPVDELVQLKNS